MKKILVLLCMLLAACTFNVVSSNGQSQDASPDQDAGVNQDGAANPNADLLQLTNLTQLYYNCQRFSTVDAGPKHLGYSATYNPAFAQGAFPVYMCSTYMNSSCNVESLFVNEQSYYRSSAPTLQVETIAQLPNTLQTNCNLSFTNEIGGNSYTTVGGFGNASLSSDMVQYITKCSSDGGNVYMVLMEFYNSEFSAFMSKDTAVFTFTCN